MLTETATEPPKTLPLFTFPPSRRPLAGLTVLVVEDSRFASEAVRLLCLKSGARIRRADCLRSALRHLRTYRPAVVIVDLGLPDGCGVQLIADLHRASPRVPVVLAMSGDPDRAQAALDAGADDFLAKPLESLAAFQQAVLSALPRDAAPAALRLMPDDLIRPDLSGLRDDLTHVADVLSGAHDTTPIDYIARFLAGVARSSHDPALEAAATALARDHQAGHALATDLARISGMVQDRLSRVADL